MFVYYLLPSDHNWEVEVGEGCIEVRDRVNIRNRYNQVPHIPRTPYEKIKEHNNLSHTRGPRGHAISQQMTTRLQ